MNAAPTLPALIERFFTDRLMRQRRVSPTTVTFYRDSFRLLLKFAQKHLGKEPDN
jgi:hypothetical protein